MCRKATIWVSGLLFVSAVQAQSTLDWRRAGTTALDVGLASLASGPVDRVWYSPDASKLYARTTNGRVFETNNFDEWQPANIQPPAPDAVPLTRFLPEQAVRVKAQNQQAGRLYAVGTHAYRSDDGGFNWTNLTAYKQSSIIGDGLYDVAASPRNPDEVVVAGTRGVWRSMDAGASWIGLNAALPNLPVARLVALPETNQALRVLMTDGSEFEWRSGDRGGWQPVESILAREAAELRALSQQLTAQVVSVARAGDFLYAGSADGFVWASPDQGRTWPRKFRVADGGAVVRIYADAADPMFAVALTAGPLRSRVSRTLNGGLLWDDVTSSLPRAVAHGVTADRATGAIYVASDAGVYMAYTDPVALSPAAQWTLIRDGRAMDVMLDAGSNQIYVAADGTGVFATLAPHRARAPRVVSAADLQPRAAAPGALLSVLGRQVQSAQAAGRPAPVLAASGNQSQIQVPFDVTGSNLPLAMESSAGRITMGLPLQETSAAIFVDKDSNPILLNADTGLALDAGSPARSGTRVQILATGLGRVRPDWPTGIAAPLDNPPQVIAPIRAFIDREPVEVTRAVLAPGYIGFYLIELQLPRIVNSGPAELYLETTGQQSNRVRLFLEP